MAEPGDGRDGKDVEVEVGLDERTMTRARTRFVERRPPPEPPRPPELGDPWCRLTVRARLLRMAETFRRVPHTPDTKPQGHRSCMPEPLREVFKDQPGEPMRLPVGKADLDAANQVLDSLVTLNRLNKIVAWHIANRLGDRRLGRYVRRDGKTAARLKQKLLDRLAHDWTARGWPLQAEDVREARALIHRNFESASAPSAKFV